MMDQDTGMLRILTDRMAIQEIFARYARAADRCDHALLLSLFHPDAQLDYSGIYNGGPAAFCAMAIDTLRGFGPVAHYFTLPYIDLEGDTATSETYAIAFHRVINTAEPYEAVLGGRHLDRFERRHGEWRIAAKHVIYDWSRDAAPAESWGRGVFGAVGSLARKDARDPLYAFAGATARRSD